jgi:hypothetical protein
LGGLQRDISMMGRGIHTVILAPLLLALIMSCAAYQRYSFSEDVSHTVDGRLILFKLEKKRDREKPRSYYYKNGGMLFFEIDWQINETYLGTVCVVSEERRALISQVVVTNERDSVLFAYNDGNVLDGRDVVVDSTGMVFPLAIGTRSKEILVRVVVSVSENEASVETKEFNFKYVRETDRYIGPVFFGG